MRSTPLRSHCSPKTSSSAPTTSRIGWSGTSRSAVPSTVISAASTTRPPAAPTSATLQERVLPTATTIADISITSMLAARKVVTLTVTFTAVSPKPIASSERSGCLGPRSPATPHEGDRVAALSRSGGQPAREAGRVTTLQLVEDLLTAPDDHLPRRRLQPGGQRRRRPRPLAAENGDRQERDRCRRVVQPGRQGQRRRRGLPSPGSRVVAGPAHGPPPTDPS